MIVEFAQPLWWIAAGLVPAILFLAFRLSHKRAQRKLARFAAPNLLPDLTRSASSRKRGIKQALLLLAVALLFAAFTRPQIGADWEKTETAGIDILFVVDVSKSMLAEDIRPNRLERAKLAILDLVRNLQGDRVGLIAFAGSAFLQCPLTLDYEAFRQTLDALDTDLIPVGGTNIARAFAEAQAYFEMTEQARIIVLITDGEDLEASGIRAAREIAERGVRVITVGVGSPEGDLIPVRGPDGGMDFLRDASGNPVKTALDEATLRQIAQIGEGLYTPLGATGRGLQDVYRYLVEEFPAQAREESLVRIPIERFQWLLALALLLLISETFIGSRRGFKLARNATSSSAISALLALSALVVLSPDLSANPAREAAKAHANGDFEQAIAGYEHALESDPDNSKWHFNLGVAAFRLGQFERASDAFERAIRSSKGRLRTQAFFNLANTQAAAGFEQLESSPANAHRHWIAAIETYENALALDPDYRDANQNRDRLTEELRARLFELTIATEPAEAGSPVGAGTHFKGVEVSLAANANAGWEFAEWQGSESIADPTKANTTITLDSDQQLTARYARTWQLTVSSANPEMGSAGKSGRYREGTPVPLKAEPKDYFAFDRWTATAGEIEDAAAAETTISLSSDSEVTASFVPAFKLSVELEPEIAGKAGPSGFFEEYSVVPIQAEPRPGFEWRNWIGTGINNPAEQQTTVALTSDKVVVAKMERIWNLVLIPVQDEGGTVEGGGNFPVGTTTPIKAVPNEGFVFRQWEGPGVADPAAPETSVTVASNEHNLFAIFEQEDQNGDDQQDQQDEQEQSEQDQQQSEQDQSEQNDSSEQEQSEADQDQPQENANEDGGQEPEPTEPEEQQQEESAQPQDASESNESAQPTSLLNAEEAIQLLNALRESERFLPAIDETAEGDDPNQTGRNW